MTIKEYINKNLLNLNWNILPQIFEEDEIELTDEIKAYLKETPWNTNWNLLKEMFEGKNPQRTIAFQGLITTVKSNGHDPYASKTISNATIPTGQDYIIITVDGVEYNLPSYETVGYGEVGSNGPSFANYPCFVTVEPSGFIFFTHNGRDYLVTIEYEEV